MAELLPLFLNLSERDVLLVGGGRVAAGKLRQLLDVGARVRVVAPQIGEAIRQAGVPMARRPFVADDVNGAWLVVAAATPAVNREVASAAEARRIFVNAVDDPANASAFLSGVVRRDGVTIAVSTGGAAPALTSLLRQALDAILPRNLAAWMVEAARQRAIWRRDQVPMEARTPRLLRALNELHSRPEGLRHDGQGRSNDACHDCQESDAGTGADGDLGDAVVAQAFRPAPSAAPARPASSADATVAATRGHVSLVGAGPGDPGLLTRSALSRLRSADLVLYDALIDDRLLRYARKAQRFFVGKRAGRRAMTDEAIHVVMIRAARRGRRVVRLKGGDPFVFGRGGEEVRALERAGVSFDVVPGVTSAIAAPALAGIPVTYRGIASAFLVVSGHDEQAFAASVGAVRPADTTLVVLMGLGRSSALGRVLLSQGWPPATPAAIIVDASQPGQWVWRGTLMTLADGQGVRSDVEGPGTIVIGEVVAMAGVAQVAVERTYVNSR